MNQPAPPQAPLALSLSELLSAVDRVLRRALAGENARWTGARANAAKLTMKIDTIGIRPTGAQADASPIVQTALSAAKALGFTSKTEASSTDANIPISMGIPGIRIAGGGKGEGAHSLGEFYEDGPNGYLGPQWAALIVAALAGVKP